MAGFLVNNTPLSVCATMKIERIKLGRIKLGRIKLGRIRLGRMKFEGVHENSDPQRWL